MASIYAFWWKTIQTIIVQDNLLVINLYFIPSLFFFPFLIFFFFFLGPHPWHMEVPRLGAELELQLPACTTATARWDLSHICDLHHSSWQRQILTHWAKPENRTHILKYTRWVLNPLSHNKSSSLSSFYLFFFLIFCLFRAAPMAYGNFQGRGQIGAVVTGLHHNHSNAESKLHLQHITQFLAMPDP